MYIFFFQIKKFNEKILSARIFESSYLICCNNDILEFWDVH